jgi:hypothetical protein
VRGPLAALACGLIACGSGGGAAVDAGLDAAVVPALEQVEESLPRGLSARDRYPDGSPLASRPWKLVDDCRVCMVGTLGLKCSRRTACTRPVCVLTDGTELAAGASVDTAWCHTCTCDGAGVLRCTARVDAGCPAGRCRGVVFGQELDLAVGEERATGECSVARCTADGLEHANICHDGCISHTGEQVPLDHAAYDVDGCAICTCNYGSWCCERRAECPLTIDDPGCPGPGTCTAPTGETVRGGGEWSFGDDKVCLCAGGEWTACRCGPNPC